MPLAWQKKPKGAYHHRNLERALLDVALHTIREEGMKALTLRGVGARLHVSRTALYRHFESKAALLARVAAEGFRMLHDTQVSAVNRAAADGTDMMQAMASAYVRFALDSPAHYETMFGGVLSDFGRYPELAQHAAAAFSVLVDAVRGEQERGRIVPGDPVALAEICWSLSHGVATLSGAGHLRCTGRASDEFAALACRLLENGLHQVRSAVTLDIAPGAAHTSSEPSKARGRRRPARRSKTPRVVRPSGRA